MPARTVVFDAIRKHDGVRPRDLYPGEFMFISAPVMNIHCISICVCRYMYNVCPYTHKSCIPYN